MISDKLPYMTPIIMVAVIVEVIASCKKKLFSYYLTINRKILKLKGLGFMIKKISCDTLSMCDEAYLPREDTYLMQQALDKIDLKGKRVLEIGCGSGYLSIFCAKKGAEVSAVDINKKALESAKKEANKEKVKISFFQSDLFSNIKEKFDIIFFNPPYLISDKIEQIALDGGKEGREIIDKFLLSFDEHLNEKGIVFLLHTDYNNLEKTEKILKKKFFSCKIVAKQHLFFEELYILEIKAMRS